MIKKKPIQLPFGMRNEFVACILRSRVGIILSNWAFQGMRYMNKYERLYRIKFELFIIIGCFMLLSLNIDHSTAFFISFLLVHTLFWLFNGHFFVLMRFIINWQNNPIKFISYVKQIQKSVCKKRFLLGAVAFGSFSKGNLNESSDFDVRLIRKKGVLNSILAFNYCAIERAKAFFNAFPLDIYVFDLDEVEHKIKIDEPPVIMHDPDGVLNNKYKNRKIEFNEFYNKFQKNYKNSR